MGPHRVKSKLENGACRKDLKDISGAGKAGHYLRGRGSRKEGKEGGYKHGVMNSPSLPKDSVTTQSKGSW